jgi:hypothetical protein
MAATESLAARAEAMLNRLAEAQAEAASWQARTQMEVARARASGITDGLRAARDAVPVLEECGVGVGRVMPGTMLQDVVRARTALRAAATSMVGGQPDEIASRIGSQSVDTALGVADKLNKMVLSGLNRSVERWRQEILPAGIGDRIVAYPGTSDHLAVRLENIQRRLQQRVENLAPGQLTQRAHEIMRDAAAWVQERPRLDTSLEDRNPDVREFLLQAATEEGASWDLITPAVADWLEDPENTVKLRVVLRS